MPTKYPFVTFFPFGGKMHWSADTADMVRSRMEGRELHPSQKEALDLMLQSGEPGHHITIEELAIVCTEDPNGE